MFTAFDVPNFDIFPNQKKEWLEMTHMYITQCNNFERETYL